MMRLAAEQLRMVALGASPGKLANDSGKLRSSGVMPRWSLRRCSAAQAFCEPLTCGFTAGYRTPLLRSESQGDHHSTDTPNHACLQTGESGAELLHLLWMAPLLFRAEYEGYVRANKFVAILQAKARKLLSNSVS